MPLSRARNFAAGTALLPSITTTGDPDTGIWFPAADTIAFSEGGTEVLRIDSSGNLGLSFITSAWGTNYKAIESSALSSVAIASANANPLTLYGNAYATNTQLIYRTTAQAALYECGNVGTHRWYVAPSGTAGTAITLTQAMTMTNAGNVGIGTTSPVAPLHVAGTMIGNPAGDGVLLGNTSNYGVVHLNGSAGGIIDFSTSGTDFKGRIIYNNTGNAMTFYANGIDRGTINDRWTLLSAQAGNFGTRTLNLDGPSISSPGIGFHAPINSSAGIIIYEGSVSSFYFVNSTNSGFVPILASAFTIGSDYRLKTNIVDLQSGLQDIMNLSPKKYTLFDSDKESRGFIAHEVSPHIPEAVRGEFNAEDERGFPVYQTLDPASILATAVAAIKELKILIDQQAIEIQQLKEKLNA